MNKHQTLVAYGIIIMLSGICLVVFAFNPVQAIQYLVGIGMCLSAAVAFIASYQCRKLQVPSLYHALHGIGMGIYGICILFFANDLERFFTITTFYLLYYGVAEIIFCFQSLILKDEFIFRSFVTRLVIGTGIALGAVFIIATTYIDHKWALMATGIVFILSGIDIIPFKSVQKNLVPPVNNKNHHIA